MRTHTFFACAAAFAIAACGSGSGSPGGVVPPGGSVDSGTGLPPGPPSTGGDDGGGGNDSGSGGNDSGSGGNDSGGGGNDSGGGGDSGPPGGSATGKADGTHEWGGPVYGVWSGKPDSAASTVVYLANQPITCGHPVTGPASGWDTSLPTGLQLLELKMGLPAPPTTFPTSYAVTNVGSTGSAPPPSGKTFALWALEPLGTGAETPGDGTDVTVTALNAGTNITGAFTLSFGGNALTGSFNAAYCATGGEP